MSATHDYTNAKRGWGHDLSYRPVGGNALKASGWGPGAAGDYVLLSNGDDSTRYRFGDDFKRSWNPGDQWFATLEFAPRPPTSSKEKGAACLDCGKPLGNGTRCRVCTTKARADGPFA